MRKLVKVFESEEHEGDWPTNDAAKFLTWLKEKLNQIPEEFRSSATIDIESTQSYGSPYATLEIYYYRPEAEEEMIMRANTERGRQEGMIQRELLELERLKKKYGQG